MSDMPNRLRVLASAREVGDHYEGELTTLSEAANRIELLEGLLREVQMSDKALADRVVALGVGDRSGTAFWRTPSGHHLDAPEFVRDWRVAGALMERCEAAVITIDTENADPYVSVLPQLGPEACAPMADSLPRAIAEACVQALEAK